MNEYTAVCRYEDNGQPYVSEVEADGPEAALDAVQIQCEADNGHPVDLQILALIRGPVELVDFDDATH